MFIKKTKDIKIFNFLNKVYHIKDELTSISRKNLKRVTIKSETVGKMLLTGMLTRERSVNQIIEKIHKRKKYRKMFYTRRKDTKDAWL